MSGLAHQHENHENAKSQFRENVKSRQRENTPALFGHGKNLPGGFAEKIS
jgi:hypothetical protein